MAKKTTPDIVSHEVEVEIAKLAGENSKGHQLAGDSSKKRKTLHNGQIKELFEEFTKKQDTQNASLLSSLTVSNRQSNQALILAIKGIFSKPNVSAYSAPRAPVQLQGRMAPIIYNN